MATRRQSIDPAQIPRKPNGVSVSREGWIWLAACVALWIVGWVKGINLILLLSYVLFALWGLNWISARRALRGLGGRRLVSSPLFAGKPERWQVEVAADGRRPIVGWELHDESSAHAGQWYVGRLGPGQRIRLRGEVQFPRRGSVDCRPLRATSSYPFGLFRRQLTFGTRDRIVVFPAIGTLNKERLRRWLMHASRPDERHRRTRRRLALEVEFHGLRTFRPGDSPRWIHWRTSARRGELMVREFDQGTHCDLLLIVDAFQPESGESHLEAALSLAATIAWQWSQEVGDRVLVALAAEDTVIVSSRDGPDKMTEVLGALADTVGASQPNLDALAAKLDCILLPAGPALCVSSRNINGPIADRLSARLGRPLAVMNAAQPPEFYSPPSPCKNS
jgi:uncharacterized protein (DUF58 family)